MEIYWDKFKGSFETFVIQDLRKALNYGLETGAIVLTVVGIECLSGYFTGKPSNEKTFEKFIKKFMPSYASHAKALYACVRNGLAHDYIIKEVNGKSFLFTRNRGEKHLLPVENQPNWYYLNREQFALDFLKAQKDYFVQVEADENLLKNALLRLNERSFMDVFSFRPSIMFVDGSENDEQYNGATGTYPIQRGF